MRGTVLTWTVPADGHAPEERIVALVALEDGSRVVTDLVGARADQLAAGVAVRVDRLGRSALEDGPAGPCS